MISETKEEKEDNQTKQQGLPSMLIRHFDNQCLKQLMRHQVKHSFNNLNIGHIVVADSISKLLTTKAKT